MIPRLLIYSTLLLFFQTCKKSASFPPDKVTYLHLSHTRSYGEDKTRLMPEVEEIDFSAFDMLLLGGDLVAESSGEQSTLHYLDSIFKLSHPRTLWTLGNHDYHHHPEWIPAITQRPRSYSFHRNGVTYLVMDAQEQQCNTEGQQLSLFNSVMDTLQESTHLILLHHKLLWMMDNNGLQDQIDQVANGGFGGCFHCVPNNNFYGVVYPRLVEVQQAGIDVFCIAGDVGVKVNEFAHRTKDGIHFLASGLKDGASNNKVLLLEHDRANGLLEWYFSPLDSLGRK